MIDSKDLTTEAPRSPRIRLGGYAILARALDKGRASLNGKNGGYHFDCPLDNYLFSFKEVAGADLSALLAGGASDQQAVEWLDGHGAPKSVDEITAFSDAMEAARPFDDPAKRDWFVGECEPLGIDPTESSLFDYLEKDDAAL
jgi:hypothetical protein